MLMCTLIHILHFNQSPQCQCQSVSPANTAVIPEGSSCVIVTDIHGTHNSPGNSQNIHSKRKMFPDLESSQDRKNIKKIIKD